MTNLIPYQNLPFNLNYIFPMSMGIEHGSFKSGLIFFFYFCHLYLPGCNSNQDNEQVNLESKTEINHLTQQLNESLND